MQDVILQSPSIKRLLVINYLKFYYDHDYESDLEIGNNSEKDKSIGLALGPLPLFH